MACSTCSGNRIIKGEEPTYIVTYANGVTEEVKGARQARVKVVSNPGATYAAK